MSNETQEFKSDTLEVKAKRKEGCLIDLDVFVSPEAAKAAYKKAIKNIRIEVSVPGFRKGKAPEALLEKNYRPHIQKEWHDILLRTSFNDATKLASLYPMDQERLFKPDLKAASVEDGAHVQFSFVTHPSIPSFDPKSIEIEEVLPESVVEKDVEEAFDEFLLSMSTWEEIEGRGVEEGDYVDLTIEAAENPQKKLVEKERFHVIPNKMGAWLRKLIEGKKVGDECEGMSELDPSLSMNAEAFKPTHCKVTIEAIKKPSHPEMNEEFFKKCQSKDIEEIKGKIKQKLENDQARFAKEKMLDLLGEKLDESVDFDIPKHLIEQEKKRYVSKKVEEEGEGVREQAEKESSTFAKKALKHSFILMDISQKEKIQVEKEEIVQEMMQFMLRFRKELDDNTKARIYEQIYYTLLNRKAEEFLLQQATKKKKS